MENNLLELFVDGQKLEVKDAPMYHHLNGLSFTATGYGARIPTTNMVKFNNRWMRVYCCIFSNSGTCFIGKNIKDGHIVRDYA